MPGVATSWILFPLVLSALCLGWGWLLAALIRVRVAGALVPGLGMAGIVIVGQCLTVRDATAELATPVVAAFAGVGLAVGVARRLGRPSGWALAAALATFAVYAAPVALSGEATFAGFIKLDDSASWMAFTDQLMEHGRDLSGLAPSTHEATLAFNLGDGYPAGVFVPLGVATALVGEDVAWVIQPYLALWAALLALALYALGRGAVAGPRARAAVAFVAAQPALLYGYYLWGGIKEVAAIALIATAAALLITVARGGPVRRVIPAAVAIGALAGVLSIGGLVWVGPALAAAGFVCVRRLGWPATTRRAALLAIVVGVAVVPLVLAGALIPPTFSPLTAAGALGNLGDPLDPAQVAGVWPVGDFRSYPASEVLGYLLVAVVGVCAALGLVIAWRRGAWWAAAFVAGTLVAALAIGLAGSPWVDGKALATASATVPFATLIAAFAVWGSGRRMLGAGLAVLVAVGVVWSNTLAYRGVNLAPRERLAELEEIGKLIAEEGPTLMTEYNPYGARHFLRDGEAEGVSELRRRAIPLADGTSVEKGQSADTDELDPDDLLVYRSLVVRRSPVRSRPPSPYRLVAEGRWYELWQRSDVVPAPIERLALGGQFDPGAVPACAAVLDLARDAGPRGELVAATVPEPLVLATDGGPMVADVPRPGRYSAWLLGSVRGEATLMADGDELGRARHQLNHEGGYVELGAPELPAGETELDLALGGADLHPGSGGPRPDTGPLVLVPVAEDKGLLRVPATRAENLCGRRLDWIEVATR